LFGQASHYKIGQSLVTGADAIQRSHQIKNDAFTEFGGNQQVLYGERKILG